MSNEDVAAPGERRATYGEFRRWYRRMQLIGGCANPVHLVGHTITRNAAGQVVHAFTSRSQPYGRLLVACGNRRQEVCPACALLHRGDTYQIVIAGLAGGKGIGPEVASHPRVFATLTAPSFGPVHRAGACGSRRAPACPHNAAACGKTHRASDVLVGTPLCPVCYDYESAVLWNASTGRLWHHYCERVRYLAAVEAGVTRSELRSVLRIAFVKVVEYQKRGAVHLHAVIRLDGPGGPSEEPPAWADASLLAHLARQAAPLVAAHLPDGRVMRFGDQVDVQEIHSVGPDEADAGVSERRAAWYVAKYVSKGDGAGLVIAHRLHSVLHIESAPVPSHGKSLMRAAWRLGGYPEYQDLKLRAWAHQLGFRGHIATKSLGYSTTYGRLRHARAQFRREAAGIDQSPDLETESSWRYAGSGLSPDQAEVAAGIADWSVLRRGPRPAWIEMPQEVEP